jgi:aspartate/methionine/tyrosine aminotransferase
MPGPVRGGIENETGGSNRMIRNALSSPRVMGAHSWDQPVRTDEQDVIDLSLDSLLESTSSSVRAATIARLMDHEADHYVRRAGLKPLCEAVARRLADRGVDVDPESGVVIAGSVQEARFVAVWELADEAAMGIPSPWVRDHFAPLAYTAGGTIETFDPSRPLSELQSLDVEVLLLPNPNQATGQTYGLETLQRLAAWARSSDLIVIADESAASFLRPEVPFASLAALPDAQDRTLTLGGFAQVPGLAAWGAGWLAGPSDLALRVRKLKQALTICSPAPSQFAALAGTTSDEQGAHRQERMTLLVDMLQRLRIPYTAPHTVAYVVADVGALGGGDRVASACLRRGVRVLDGARFGRPEQIRVTASGSRFEEALSRLERCFLDLEKGRASSD